MYFYFRFLFNINNRASSLWKPRTRHVFGVHDVDTSRNKSQDNDNANDDDVVVTSSSRVVSPDPLTSSPCDDGQHPESNSSNSSTSETEVVDKSKSDELPAPLKMIFPGTSSDFSLESDELVEEDELVSLWLPGKIIHIYPYNGVYLASEVPKNFPNLRKIGLYNVFIFITVYYISILWLILLLCDYFIYLF